MAIKWDESWNTGISVIDQQHRKLLNLVNDLNDAMRQGKSRDVVDDVLTVLVEYTRTHFNAEERLMEKVKYNEIVEHKAQHADFVQKIEDFLQKAKAGSPVLSIEMMNFLSSWIINHIKGTDARYVPVLLGRV
jgi:hemerythrin